MRDGVVDPEENGSGGLLTFQIERTKSLILRRDEARSGRYTGGGKRDVSVRKKTNDIWQKYSPSFSFFGPSFSCQTSNLTRGPICEGVRSLNLGKKYSQFFHLL